MCIWLYIPAPEKSIYTLYEWCVQYLRLTAEPLLRDLPAVLSILDSPARAVHAAWFSRWSIKFSFHYTFLGSHKRMFQLIILTNVAVFIDYIKLYCILSGRQANMNVKINRNWFWLKSFDLEEIWRGYLLGKRSCDVWNKDERELFTRRALLQAVNRKMSQKIFHMRVYTVVYDTDTLIWNVIIWISLDSTEKLRRMIN